jgi:hypothetical protein
MPASTKTKTPSHDVLTTLDGNQIKNQKDFLRFVRERRDSLAVNKTQSQVAKALDYSSGEYWGLIEAGKRNVDPEKVPLWADILVLDRKAFTKLYLKIFMPNIFFTFWGEEHLASLSPDAQKKFVRITEPEIDLLNKLNKMPAVGRRSVVSMVELLAAKPE